MKRFLGADDAVIYRCERYHDEGFDPSVCLVDSVIVSPYTTGTERVMVFSRGRVAGQLILARGDGAELAAKVLD